MKLLCAADLHLGRQPSRLPGALSSAAAELTPAAAWRRLVRVAKAREVRAVLLAGDVLDDEHDFFEAYGDLKAGVEELVAAGIAVLAVSGNHDVEVLPRLAQAVPGVTLLGEGGRWEAHTLDDGTNRVHVVGWSYPARSVTYSPLANLPEALTGLTPAPVVGLLHCDRDQSGSRYAPVTSLELAAVGVDAWLLGHVHRPDLGTFAPNPGGASGSGGGASESGAGAPVSGYLGSIFAADSGEEGGRGAWLLEVDGGALALEPVPLSPLRFESLTVDVSALRDAADSGQAVAEALSDLHARLRGEHAILDGGAVAVGCRLVITGRSALRAELAKRLADDDPRELLLTLDGVSYFVHDVRLEVLPAIDLAAAAAGNDPLALLARKLLVLDGPPSAEQHELLERGRAALLAVAAGRHYRGLEPPALPDAVVADQLRLAALKLIDLMATT